MLEKNVTPHSRAPLSVLYSFAATSSYCELRANTPHFSLMYVACACACARLEYVLLVNWH
jgi:hypothetical protein